MTPKGDYCFVKSAPEETQTTGGILLPPSAARKPTTGTVESVGDGRVGPINHKFTVTPGDTVSCAYHSIYTMTVLTSGSNLIP